MPVQRRSPSGLAQQTTRRWKRPASTVLALAVLAALCLSGAAAEDNIVKLNKFNFDKNVKRGHWFVKFYAPWCTHCQRLAPIWEKLADHAVKQDWPVKIAEVDCTSSGEICDKAMVKGFPTMALISEGLLKSRYKEGEASLQHFENWLSKQGVLKGAPATSAGGSDQQQQGSKILMVTEDRFPEKAGGGASAAATHGQALFALFSNLLGRFPSQNKVINLYFYAAVGLAGLVGALCFLFKLAEAGEDEEDKED